MIATYRLGDKVRITERNTGMGGRVVTIRCYRALGPGIYWPCFEDQGEMWPLNPEWLAPTGQRETARKSEQMSLFGDTP